LKREGGHEFFLFSFEKGRAMWVYLFTIFLVFYYYLYFFVTFFTSSRGGGWHGFYYFVLFFVLCVSFCYRFFVLLVKKAWVYFSYFILNNFFGIFYFLKGERGHKLFKNLLRGEGISLITLFWKKKLLKDGNGLGWVRIFFKALIVDGGKGHGLYFFILKNFMFVIFWDLLFLKEGKGGKVGRCNNQSKGL